MGMEQFIKKQKDLLGQIKDRINIKTEEGIDQELAEILFSGLNALNLFVFIAEILNGKCVYSFANQAGLDILQSDQSLYGKTFEEVLSKESAESLKQHYLKAAASKEVVTFENELVLQDGQKLMNETVLTPFFDEGRTYIIAFVKDISESKQAMEQLLKTNRRLEENEKRLSSLVENNTDAVFLFHNDGYFLEVNAATETIIGYSMGHLIGKHFSTFVTKKERDKAEEQFQLALQGKQLHMKQQSIIKRAMK